MRIAIRILFLIAPWVCNAQDTTHLSLLFVGDIMQHESQIKSAYNPATDRYEYAPTFDGVKSVLSKADITIGNLELTLGGKPYTGYPQFSAPDELLPALRDAGFDVLVTANNHSMDRGRRGLERTLDRLDSMGIQHTGTFRDTLERLNEYPLVLERNGIRVALLNYTYGTNGIAVRPPNIVNRIDTVLIGRDIRKAASQADLTIVFFHWGDEYQPLPNEFQKKAASFCLSRGAKVVIGSHPHVLQPMTWNKETGEVVVYSLGNFVSGQRVRYRNGGAIVEVVVQKSGMTTRVSDVSYSLAWVYRASDSRRSFHLVPVGDGVDTVRVKGNVSRAMMKEFIDDSRSFLEKENVNVREKKR